MAIYFKEFAFVDVLGDTDTDKKDLRSKIAENIKCSPRRLWKIGSYFLPILKFLKYYKFKESILIDALTGVIIGIMHIPQAFAFGLLTSVKIENGLYTSVWPVLLYVFFGTSPHVSIGTSAVICMMTASIVDREAEEFKVENTHLLNSSVENVNGTFTEQEWETIPEFMDFKENIAMNISLYSGCILILMGMLRLGFITAYFSVSFFSAFTSGAAVHIATSQLPALFGIQVPRFAGAFKLLYTYKAFFSRIAEVEIPTIVITVVSIALLLAVKKFINERYKEKLPIPVPTELIVVILSTIISYFIGLEENFSVDVVGDIPHEIPAPTIPTPIKFPHYVLDCLIISLLIYANTIAMAKICAKKHNYEIDNNQELFAYGICNFASSFMRCFPSSVAPPRSMVASAMNVKTTVSGLFSAVLMLLVIVALTPIFKYLPNSALASIIVVALLGLFVQMADGVRYWRINKYDFLIWLSTLIGVVIFDIDIGLGIGLSVSLFTVVLQSQRASSIQLWKRGVSETDTKQAYNLSGIKIFQFRSNLFYANSEIFRDKLYRYTVHPRKFLKLLKKKEKKCKSSKTSPAKDVYVIKSEDNDGFENATFDVSKDEKLCTVNDSCGYPDYDNITRDNDHKGSVASASTDIEYLPNLSYFEETPEYVNNLKFGQDHDKSGSSVCSRKTEDSGYDEDDDNKTTESKFSMYKNTHCIIIDCSSVNYIDVAGAGVLSHIATEYSKVNIRFYLCGCSRQVLSVLVKSKAIEKIMSRCIFQDLLDAVGAAEKEITVEKMCPADAVSLKTYTDFTDEEAAEESYVTKL